MSIPLIAIETLLYLSGTIAFFWLLASSKGRPYISYSRLALWKIPPIQVIQSFIILIGCIYVLLLLANHLIIRTADGAEHPKLYAAAGFQLGLLAGIITVWFFILRRFKPCRQTIPPEQRFPAKKILPAAIITFLVAIPSLTLIDILWKELLSLFDYKITPQPIVTLLQTTDDGHKKLGFALLAICLAPVCEELIFRAGIFRWLRTNLTWGSALFLSSGAFAILHGNTVTFLPLLALGILFSISYELTGRIAVPIIAHALFNLHTFLLILLGISTTAT